MAIVDELTAIAAAPAITAGRIDLGLTVVTFNVQRWNGIVNTLGGLFGKNFHTEQWEPRPHARQIASYLNRRGADIVIMQEAWDPEFLLLEMADLGYHGIASIQTSDSIVPGISYPLGSGLAFFSRHPFRPLGKVGMADVRFTYAVTNTVIPASASPAGELPTGSTILARKGWLRYLPGSPPTIVGVPSDHVAFHRFEHSAGIDAAAAKGIALVKIDFQDNVLTVVGTHLDASSSDARSQQYDEIDEFLRRNLPTNFSDWGHVFFAGDLNTHGDHEAEHEPWNQHLAPSTDPGATLLRRNFSDTWDQFAYPPRWRENDPVVIPGPFVDRTDPGDTAGIFRLTKERSRIDFILWHAADRPAMTASHSRVLTNAIADSGTRSGAALSDHWPYAVTFVTTDDFASSSSPLRINGSSAAVLSSFTDSRIQLATPSSIQWFVVLEPGSYAISAKSLNPSGVVDVEVYRASNLSEVELPVPGELLDIKQILDQQEEVFAVEYRWRPEPIFIKVFQPTMGSGANNNRVPNLQYRLVVVPLNGSTPALAPPISPGETVEWELGTQIAIPTEATGGEIWFKYSTIGPFNHLGRPQLLEIHARTVDGGGAEVHANVLAVFDRTSSGIPGGVISAAQVAEDAAQPVKGAKSVPIQDRNENWKFSSSSF